MGMSEIIKEARSAGEALDGITAIVEEKKSGGFADYDFYFRGENRNFFTNDGEIPSA